jgi:hypothetical protein
MLHDRLAAIATAATVAIMFLSIVYAAPMLRNLETMHAAAGTAAGALVSVGV